MIRCPVERFSRSWPGSRVEFPLKFSEDLGVASRHSLQHIAVTGVSMSRDQRTCAASWRDHHGGSALDTTYLATVSFRELVLSEGGLMAWASDLVVGYA